MLVLYRSVTCGRQMTVGNMHWLASGWLCDQKKKVFKCYLHGWCLALRSAAQRVNIVGCGMLS